MRDIFKPSIILFSVCIIVTVCLAFTYNLTKSTIQQRALLDAENSRKEVLKQAQSFEKIKTETDKSKAIYITNIYEGFLGNASVGYVVSLISKGYGGPVEVVVGIDKVNMIKGVKLGTNNETPGLGTKAAEPKFINQFFDKVPKGKLQVIKTKRTKNEEIEAISGATITSKAVTEAVQVALDKVSELNGKGGMKK